MAITPLPPSASAGDAAIAQLDAARASIAEIGVDLHSVASDDLARLAASAAAVIAAAEAARVAIVLEASSRGVVASSDHPRVKAWVEQTCRDADIPVTTGMARQVQDITRTCIGHDVTPLREAVTSGRLPMDSAATVATVFRRLKHKVDCPHWDDLAEILIEWAAEGARRCDLHELEERIVGQYGTAGLLDEEHDRKHQHRSFGDFRTTPDGMRTATLKLDPASEAVMAAALHALSKPQPGAEGEPDLRSYAQRRADALLTMAGLATKADPDVPGTGAKARVILTMTFADLLADLSGTGILGPTATGTWATPTTTSATSTWATATATSATAATGTWATPTGTSATATAGTWAPPAERSATIAPGETLTRTAPTATSTHGAPLRGTASTTRNPGGAVNETQGQGADVARSRTDTDANYPAIRSGPADTSSTDDSTTPTPFSRTRSRTRGHAAAGFGQTLTPSEARMLACDAQIIPAVLGKNSELLDLGRSHRTITPGQTAALHERDKHCTYPGCTIPPQWCDGHHIIYWALGGRTDMNNLALLCRHHHTVVHRHDHTATVHPTHGVQWTRRDGTPIGTLPRSFQS